MKLILLYKGKGPKQLERNLLERDISENLKLDPCKETTTEPWKNESRSKSIWPCQLPGGSSYPSIHTNPQMPMWSQNLCPFIDLIKAFDTIDHTLLHQVLSKYVIPPKMQKIIKKLYMNCTVHLEIGKEKCVIEYNTGVLQGDNMAPVLSLYMIQAVMETLQTKLSFNKLQYRHFQDLKGKGSSSKQLKS